MTGNPYDQYGQGQYGQAQYGQGQYGQAQYGPGYGQPAPLNWPSEPQPPALRTDYARWFRRAGGLLIDQIPALIAQALFLIGYLQWIGDLTRSSARGVLEVDSGYGWMGIGSVAMLLALAWTAYNRWLVGGRTGQSLGRRVTRISLISEQTGQPIGPLNAFARDMCHVLDGMAYIGYLWPLWDQKRQTFADMIMKTVVVDAPNGAHDVRTEADG